MYTYKWWVWESVLCAITYWALSHLTFFIHDRRFSPRRGVVDERKLMNERKGLATAQSHKVVCLQFKHDQRVLIFILTLSLVITAL